MRAENRCSDAGSAAVTHAPALSACRERSQLLGGQVSGGDKIGCLLMQVQKDEVGREHYMS